MYLLTGLLRLRNTNTIAPQNRLPQAILNMKISRGHGGGGGLHQRRGRGQGCDRGEGTSEPAPEAVIQAVGWGCRSGLGGGG